MFKYRFISICDFFNVYVYFVHLISFLVFLYFYHYFDLGM
ncbi:hypothetical protein AB434_2465 [Heyndrickxia coagulans]|uniref:Uncharacterized protein n=1 Tax=Heyndrickxia coagulans TaxID=1398 RepID=A0A150K1W7_HEYCO|nr:hypothetical protein AB434_2465 [Heyndrickxia coagulans]KWZ77055.1 hypothetical protein HMPREF3213_03469 [Heyndrickxia coagulans]KYC63580.1 hypothetical protein B4100_0231 [Heyndrickxia coagulans]KYC90522.1 hypothetical protein B4096_0186 [Heyndrickxia coagulans]